MARKTKKICLVCGKEFEGTAAAITCSGACRTAMSRLVRDGKKPEFWLIAKSKGQKIPLFFYKPKKKQDAPVDENKADSDINYSSNVVYDSPKKNGLILDEIGQIAHPIITPEQKMAHNAKIEMLISEEMRKECPLGKHPKQFKLQQEMVIDELKQQLLN